MHQRTKARLYVVMGVAGCGKSTIGRAIADRFGAPYLEGDDFHPASNIEKMKQEVPLDDDDRFPWLEKIALEMAKQSGEAFAACSALKRIYRDTLVKHAKEPVFFIHLDGSQDLIAKRMAKREEHFMPQGLLESQFQTLQPLEMDELGMTVSVSNSPNEIIELILDEIA